LSAAADILVVHSSTVMKMYFHCAVVLRLHRSDLLRICCTKIRILPRNFFPKCGLEKFPRGLDDRRECCQRSTVVDNVVYTTDGMSGLEHIEG